MLFSSLMNDKESIQEIMLSSEAEAKRRAGIRNDRTRERRERILEKISQAQSAGEVFSLGAAEAAKILVEDAFNGERASANQILAYALGMPVKRVMSLTAQVSGMSEVEIERGIEEQLRRLGYKAGEGSATAFIVGERGDQGEGPPQELQAASAISGESGEFSGSVHEINGARTSHHGGESVSTSKDEDL